MTEKNVVSNGAQLFIDTVIKRAYDRAINDVVSILEKGPPGKHPSPELVELHKWYNDLDAKYQVYILQIIRESVEASVFGFLVILDGVFESNPIKAHLSDWALYLQTYEELDDKKKNQPQSATRLNSIPGTEELHDLFQESLKSH